jgi:glycerophosphoryl diester phosphodiesterase
VSVGAFARGQHARPLVYGHRGTRRGAPENTLLAMRHALDQGADGVELDVRLCKSGEVIVLHDPDLRRVAGAAIAAANTALPELLRHDLGRGERVPLLEQAMDVVLGAGRLLNIELKADVPDRAALAHAVAERVAARSRDQSSRVLFSSFSAELCVALCAALPDATVALLFVRERKHFPPGVKAVHPQHTLADAAAIAGWHRAGLLVNAFPVNDVEPVRALAAAGIDGIVTDDVPLVLRALAATAPSSLGSS